MDTRLRQINREMRAYEPELFAARNRNGMIRIMRKSTRFEAVEWEGQRLLYSVDSPMFILGLTDNWLESGKPVEWGLEPLIERLREMDQWRDDGLYARLVRNRERLKEEELRRTRNTFRALAADARRDFAKATNDINTSTLAKIDKRRN